MTSKSQSRNSSPKTPSSRRPKLMRASATEPSLATSNASRKDLASLHCSSSSSRAASLLTRVASYSSAQCEREAGGRRDGRGSRCSTPGQSPRSLDGGGERKEPFEILVQQSGNYFSFPSFEDFQEYQSEQERIEGRMEKGVP